MNPIPGRNIRRLYKKLFISNLNVYYIQQKWERNLADNILKEWILESN